MKIEQTHAGRCDASSWQSLARKKAVSSHSEIGEGH